MRRFTFLTIVFLFLVILIAAFFQVRAATNGPRRYPGPGYTFSPSPIRSEP